MKYKITDFLLRPMILLLIVGLTSSAADKAGAKGKSESLSAQAGASSEFLVSYDFDTDFMGWGHYGEGAISHVKNKGALAPGAIKMVCSKGDQATLYKKFDLEKGVYEVEMALRSFAVKKGNWDYSTWIFYKSEPGKVKTITKNLKGTYEWSKINFTVNIDKDPLELWLRLKSEGTIWVDDIKISKTATMRDMHFAKSTKEFPKPLKVGEGKRCDNCYLWMPKTNADCDICGTIFPKDKLEQGKVNRTPRILISYENTADDNIGHSVRKFNSEFVTQGASSAAVGTGYQNLNFKKAGSNDWSGYEYIALDVYNTSSKIVNFALCVNDIERAPYWNQQNHSSKLAPGWNKLKFNLKSHVGERGSAKLKRYLNLKDVKRFWYGIGIGAPSEDLFFVDNIRLENGPEKAKSFEGLVLFDFVKDSFWTQQGFTRIETKHSYSKDIGFGFDDAKIWQAHDSMYADRLNRDGIFVSKGKFLVDLPDGDYRVELNINHLGYWNEHFWNKRLVKINNETVLDESVESFEKYLANFLRFKDIEPNQSDNAYDLYLKDVFKPIVHDVQVRNGQLSIEVNSDKSGICFNSLIIYPKDKLLEAAKYKATLYELQKNEFMTLNRYIETPKVSESDQFNEQDFKKGYYFTQVDIDKVLNYRDIPKKMNSELSLKSANGGRAAASFYLRPLKTDKNVKVTISDLVNAKGDKISAQDDWVRYGVDQYQSLIFNHEVYVLAPRFLKTFPGKGIKFSHDFNRVIWLQVPIDNQKPGLYKGKISLRVGRHVEQMAFSLEVLPFSLPSVDLPVGYFGLSSVRLGSITLPGKTEIQQKYRLNTMEELARRGYTTFSEVPGFKFYKEGGELKLDTKDIDLLMTDAKRLGFKKLFTYGGPFTNMLFLDVPGDIMGFKNEAFRKLSSALLKEKFSSAAYLPIILNISDEASGYSQKVDRDLKRVAVLNKYYPFFDTGGFSHSIEKDKYGGDLNEKFTDFSYSSISKNDIDYFKELNKNWGFYNQGIGLFDTNRQIMGQCLFVARHNGCKHLIQWYLTGSQNYPYYDLDGREYDAMMFFPRADGGHDYAIKFELSTLGLDDYRLLLLLEKLATEKNDAKAKAWLSKHYYSKELPHSHYRLDSVKHEFTGDEFRNQIYAHIKRLL
ncbi:hypothetical protein PQO03_08615 [Lentisphaera profundi]|uniref:Glycoside hydrolase 123 C-terminal domain-containing protein n=1 Tax=Lentisphaera profundi TaxID=1658616 RepID=A0ABY7VPM8_9BACT|nr:hypothetical protein [Lentisphaera profundi]WDE95776.1 hypothetical protein PQO03_08615 [Lentisphaera profundi]